MDVIRQKLMVKWNKRRKIAGKMDGKILPHIVKNLKERSRNLDMDVLEGSDDIGEVIRRVVQVIGMLITLLVLL